MRKPMAANDALAEMWERDLEAGIDPLAVDRMIVEPAQEPRGLVIEPPPWVTGEADEELDR